MQRYGGSEKHGYFRSTQNILSLRRQAKFHTAGISFADSGKFHSPKANFTVQPAAGRGCTLGDREALDEANYLLPPSGREGDREAVEGASGYEGNDLPFMRCLPLFSLVEAEVSSLLCAFSFRHPCGAGRWGEATAPCSHPGGSHSDSRRRADMESTPTENSQAAGGASPRPTI